MTGVVSGAPGSLVSTRVFLMQGLSDRKNEARGLLSGPVHPQPQTPNPEDLMPQPAQAAMLKRSARGVVAIRGDRRGVHPNPGSPGQFRVLQRLGQQTGQILQHLLLLLVNRLDRCRDLGHGFLATNPTKAAPAERIIDRLRECFTVKLVRILPVHKSQPGGEEDHWASLGFPEPSHSEHQAVILSQRGTFSFQRRSDCDE